MQSQGLPQNFDEIEYLPDTYKNETFLRSVELESINFTADESKPYLEETFYINNNGKNAYKVKLFQNALVLIKINQNGKMKEHKIFIHSIIGCRSLKSKSTGRTTSCVCGVAPVLDEQSDQNDEGDNSAYLMIYAYTHRFGKRKRTYKERTTIALRFRSFDNYKENAKESELWLKTLRMLINSNRQRQQFSVSKTYDSRGFLILLNPKAGQRRAKEIFHRVVAPILTEADVPYDLYITKCANFARNFVRSNNIFRFKGIIVCGGCGIFYEVINGIFERPDWNEVVQNITLGIIPCGYGNGVAKSLVHLSEQQGYKDTKPILSCAISLVNGLISKMDLLRVESQQSVMYSSSSFGLGFLAGVLSESVKRLSLQTRFTLWSLKSLITLPKFYGRISYLPVKVEKQTNTNISRKTQSMCELEFGTKNYDITSDDDEDNDILVFQTLNGEFSFRPRLDSWYSVNSKKSAYFSADDSDNWHSIKEDTSPRKRNVNIYGPDSSIPCLVSVLPENWVTIEDTFIMIQGAIASHISSNCCFAPLSKLTDGIIWLLLVNSKIQRSELASFLIAINSGKHIEDINKNINIIPCKAFRFEPLDNVKGIMTVDGERINYGPVQAEIIPSLLKVIVPSQKDISF